MALVAAPSSTAVVPTGPPVGGVERKSGLQAPTMILSGHKGEIFAVEFSPDGRNIATGSMDKSISIYNVYGECANWCVLNGHQNAVLEIHWALDGSGRLYSCSADKSVCIWDVEEGKRIKKLSGHQSVVNSVQTSRKGSPLLVSGGDDGTTRVWDLRTRRAVQVYEHQYQILAVTFDNTAERVFAGSLDNTIRIHDVRKGPDASSPVDCLMGHIDSITGLALSSDGGRLASNAMDHTVRIWDANPFVIPRKTAAAPPPGAPYGSVPCDSRCLMIVKGATHNFEKNYLRVRWSPDGKYCAAGSADRFACIWDIRNSHPIQDPQNVQPPVLIQSDYRLPGHGGSVNEVVFHPKEPIIASAGSDRQVFMGELS